MTACLNDCAQWLLPAGGALYALQLLSFLKLWIRIGQRLTIKLWTFETPSVLSNHLRPPTLLSQVRRGLKCILQYSAPQNAPCLTRHRRWPPGRCRFLRPPRASPADCLLGTLKSAPSGVACPSHKLLARKCFDLEEVPTGGVGPLPLPVFVLLSPAFQIGSCIPS